MQRNEQLNAGLLDEIISALNLKNDAALSRVLGTFPPVISKVRRGRLDVGPAMIIAIHDTTGWQVREIKRRIEKPSLALFKPLGV